MSETKKPCVICTTFESDTTLVSAFFLGMMTCVAKIAQYGVSSDEVWERAVSSLCKEHREAYEATSKKEIEIEVEIDIENEQ